MIGKALNSRPWITRSYEPFINEPCDKSSEDVSGENVCQKSPDFDDTDNAIYLLPPPSSSTTCLPPNPDPPEFNVQAEPIVVEPRGRSCNALIPGKSSSCTENVDPFYADSLRLQKEILNPGGIEVYVAASELLSNVALIQLQSQVWIAGWNPRVSSLHGLFHVGDLLVSVNGCDVQNLRQVAKVVEGTKKWALRENFRTPADVKCRLRLRRLPLAKTLIVCRQRQDQKIGITFDENGTNQVKSVDSDGPLACTGFPPLARRYFRSNPSTTAAALSPLRFLKQRHVSASQPDLVPWTATEINHIPLNLFYNQHEASLLIGAHGMEISATFQPSDFVKAVCKKVRKLKGYRSFF